MSLAVYGFAPTLPPAGLRLTREDYRVHKQKASERLRDNLLLETDRQQKVKAARRKEEVSAARRKEEISAARRQREASAARRNEEAPGTHYKENKERRYTTGTRAERQSSSGIRLYRRNRTLNILDYLKAKVLRRRPKKQKQKSNEA